MERFISKMNSMVRSPINAEFRATGRDTMGVKFVTPNPGRAVFHAVYLPVSDFWPLQLTETALFGGLALLLIAFAAWRVLGSD